MRGGMVNGEKKTLCQSQRTCIFFSCYESFERHLKNWSKREELISLKVTRISLPERMSERSISSDWTPMLLLKAFLQEDPLTSRSKSTGSNGELYKPYLEKGNKPGEKSQDPERSRQTTSAVLGLKTPLLKDRFTWSATVPPVVWGGPAAAERLLLAERHRKCCTPPSPPPSRSSAVRSTKTQHLRDDRTESGSL